MREEVVALYNRQDLPEVVILEDTYGDVGSIPAGQPVIVI
jgi:hypothetical protein